MIITASGISTGQSTAAAPASPITPQQWTTNSSPFHDERADRPAHSSGVKKACGLRRGTAGMEAIYAHARGAVK